MSKMIFRRLQWIIQHAQHLGSAELRWLIQRLTEVELQKAEKRDFVGEVQSSAR